MVFLIAACVVLVLSRTCACRLGSWGVRPCLGLSDDGHVLLQACLAGVFPSHAPGLWIVSLAAIYPPRSSASTKVRLLNSEVMSLSVFRSGSQGQQHVGDLLAKCVSREKIPEEIVKELQDKDFPPFSRGTSEGSSREASSLGAWGSREP